MPPLAIGNTPVTSDVKLIAEAEITPEAALTGPVSPESRVVVPVTVSPDPAVTNALKVLAPANVCEAADTRPGFEASASSKFRTCPESDAPFALGLEPTAARVMGSWLD